jgi:hypothetical protein
LKFEHILCNLILWFFLVFSGVIELTALANENLKSPIPSGFFYYPFIIYTSCFFWTYKDNFIFLILFIASILAYILLTKTSFQLKLLIIILSIVGSKGLSETLKELKTKNKL